MFWLEIYFIYIITTIFILYIKGDGETNPFWILHDLIDNMNILLVIILWHYLLIISLPIKLLIYIKNNKK